MTRKPGTFGSVETERSGRYRARYYGPDGRRYKAPTLFLTKKDARAWLALQHADIVRKIWEPPTAAPSPRRKLTLAAYAEQWLAHRDLKDRTREHYRKLLDAQILPPLGALPLTSITADDVRRWHSAMGNETPTLRAHAYGLLRTIMGTAASDGRIPANPCVIRGAGNAKRVHKIRPASLDEIEAIAAAMPKRHRVMVLLAAWCALRFGELTELRRRDVVIGQDEPDSPDGEPERWGILRVERAVVRTDDGFQVTTPKSEAGIRDVAIPPHLLPVLEDHLEQFVADQPDSLLFPAAHGGHLAPATLYRRFYTARAKANRSDLRWHDLRHSGAVLAAATGATLAELMARLGHSTPAAAMRYQHAAQGRDRQIAELLSKLAQPGV
ncbi:tyrosine-type recombinase/integrase [Mycolicibacterium elephantis]